MFNERQLSVLRVALSFALMNLDDVNDTFDNGSGNLDYCGEIMPEVTAEELTELSSMFQH